jgi:ribosomal protein S4E
MYSNKSFLLILATFIISCKENPQKPSEKVIPLKVQKTVDKPILHKDSTRDYSPNLKEYFQDYKIYSLADTIKIDFNGDQIIDKAYFNPKKNIIIRDGKSNKEVKIKNSSDNDFSWIEYWAVTNDKKTFEITIVNGEIGDEIETSIEHPSIIVRKEGIGGVITYKNGEYKWIHQAD